MVYKKIILVFFAFNIQTIEPKTSFIKRAKNFFRDPENKKIILNVATGAICATGVSLIVSYRHELAQLLWGNGNYYVDPFVDPIFIGNYPCKGLERKYKNISIKQIRVPQQSGAQCGVYALASAASWVGSKDGKRFVERIVNADLVRSWVQLCVANNSLIKKENGQWILEEALWQGISNLPKHAECNKRVMVIPDKNYISDKVVENFLVPIEDTIEKVEHRNIIPEVKKHLKNKDSSYYSIVIGTMEHSVIKPKEGVQKLNNPHGHWYTVNISVANGELEVVITDSLNCDRTDDKAVRMVIDTLLSDTFV